MDFSQSKYSGESGDGLGTKKGRAIYLKMVANLILNLAVFIVFNVLGWRKRPAMVRRTERQPDRGSSLELGLVSPIKLVGFY